MMNSDIVIAGFSGRFPESENIGEFKRNLYEGVDMVTDDERRWPRDLLSMPTRLGSLKDLASFDATFFGVHAMQTNAMDPQLRILLEVTHEAIIDAGVNPVDLRGSRTGVFIGNSGLETADLWSTNPEIMSGYCITGTSRCMFSNRISYNFDFRGPSLTLDTACSSSMYALHCAFQAIRAGECDAAIVGGVNINFSPTNFLLCHSLNILSPEGKCKVFDAECNGYVRSDAVVVIFLQKSEDAKRVYATVVNTKTNTDGYKNLGITNPSSFMQYQLLKQIYEEAGVDPRDVSYIEAHGSGTPVGDPPEVNAISQVFCENRQGPLHIGSVKSNMGHSEGACGLCSIAKVLIAMETGVIPANLHFKIPNPNIPAIINGKVKVVDKPLIWKGDLVGVSSLGFGGANSHVILKNITKIKHKINFKSDSIEKVVTVSGCTKEACEYFLQWVKENKDDNEFIGLVHNIHRKNITGHNYRGYCVLGKTNIVEIEYLQSNQDKRPVWFIFSGMGSQWPGMGKDLLKIEAFEISLKRCAEILKPKGINLIELFLNCTKETFNNVVNSLVMITTFQIGLVDILTSIGIKPDGIIGLSVGELACAYADRSLTLEQTILSAYWRGKCIVESELVPGAMAVIGLSWKETAKLLHPGVNLALHLASDIVTVSGTEKNIHIFVADLKAKGIFTNIMNSSRVAFHSEHMEKPSFKLRDELEKVIPSPKERTSSWLSSTVPEYDWDIPAAKWSSPEYFVNNLLQPVRFYETIKHIPDNAITIEIGPNCSLRTIMRKSLAETSTYIGLHKNEYLNNIEFLLSSIGKLYNAGLQPDLSMLYPLVMFPISRGTPMLNSAIRWDHSSKWFVPDYYSTYMNKKRQEKIIKIDISKEEYKFLASYSIDGRIFFPATGHLVLVWKTFAKLKTLNFEKITIIFEDVIFLRPTVDLKERAVEFVINILPSGHFELSEGGSSVVTGKIKTTKDFKNDQPKPFKVKRSDSKQVELDKKDFYKEMRLRGYNYSGIFQGVKSWNNHLKTGELYWMNNWVTFMDTMIQVHILGTYDTKKTYIPTKLRYLAIDPIQHLADAARNEFFIVEVHPNLNISASGATEMRGLTYSLAPKQQQNQALPILEVYKYVPHDNIYINVKDTRKKDFEVLRLFFQIIVENIALLKLRGIEFFTSEEKLIGSLVLDIFNDEPLVFCDYRLAIPTSSNYEYNISKIKIIKHDIVNSPVASCAHLIIANNILSSGNSSILPNLINSLTYNGYIILVETGNINTSLIKDHRLILVAKQILSEKSYFLLTRKKDQNDPIVIEVTKNSYEWIEEVKQVMRNNQKALLISQGEETSGIAGFANCIRRESEVGLKIHYVFIQDDTAPKFSITDPFYSTQLDKQLFANVLKGNQWGSYRHIKNDKMYLSKKTQLKQAYINTLNEGNLNSVTWIQSPLGNYKPKNMSNKELYSVYYAPLNSRDVMLARCKLPMDALPINLIDEHYMLGLEFAGRHSKGKRVMGIVPAKGLATTVLADHENFVWDVPQKWTLEQAATIPICYATSYYALVVRGKLQKGESILIYSGASDVGLASIIIAENYGCNIYTTVATNEKREFIKKTFPQITDRNIGYSRDTSFEQFILYETNGRGVDVVLNSLPEDKLTASLGCLAVKGRYLEIWNFNSSKNNIFGTDFFSKNITFHGIGLDDLYQDENNIYLNEKKQVIELLKKGILSGEVKPLPTTVFTEDKIEDGFRYLESGNHIGKVLIKIRDEEPKDITTPSVKSVTGIARTYLDPEKCYILVGGLGGFGLELANWMIARGAKYMVLTSRSGIRTGYQSLCVDRWQKAGAKVIISTEDVSNIESTERLLSESSKLATIGGIFNLAAVLQDGLLENLNATNFENATKAKVHGTRNLDILSRKYCAKLDYFVVMSSVASRGVPGQSNYALANSFMERLMEQRRTAGFPGLAIQWGPIGDVGIVADAIGIDNDVLIGGYVLQKVSSCLETIDLFLQNDFGSVVSSYILEDKNKLYTGNLKQVSLMQKLADIMGIKDATSVNSSSTLVDLGLDSLITAQIKQTFERCYDIVMDPQEIRALTFSKVKELEKNSVNKEDEDVQLYSNFSHREGDREDCVLCHH